MSRYRKIFNRIFTSIFLVVLLSINSQSLAADGAALFKANCAACHAINKDIMGPSLVNVIDRWPSKELLYMWINNWTKAVATGDPYAIKVKDYSSAAMTTFNLSDEEIDSILAYINESSRE